MAEQDAMPAALVAVPMIMMVNLAGSETGNELGGMSELEPAGEV